jgi:hypothetical protein
MGFVAPPDAGRGLNAMCDHDDGTQFDLKQYVALTDLGVEYLKLRTWSDTRARALRKAGGAAAAAPPALEASG